MKKPKKKINNRFWLKLIIDKLLLRKRSINLICWFKKKNQCGFKKKNEKYFFSNKMI